MFCMDLDKSLKWVTYKLLYGFQCTYETKYEITIGFLHERVVIILVFAIIYYIIFNNLQHDIVYTSYLERSSSSHFHQENFYI